jgi:serine phosphatase RsbU (regulator of sigma subunit)
MAEHAAPAGRLSALVDRVATVSPVEAVDVMADGLGELFDADHVCFLITDLSGRAVTRFGGTAANAARERQQGAAHAPAVPLHGTVYQEVLRTQRPDVRDGPGGGVLLTVPVTDRGDTLGVIELELPAAPDDARVAEVLAAGRALAHVLITCRRHTDLFEWAQRTTPFSLAAEIQRRLLPSAFTCESGQFTVAGWLEPANAVGGDTFDYALDRDDLHLSITDAVGHDVQAALLATVLVGSLRNSRRRGRDLPDQARTANDALEAHSPRGEFVTGQLVRVDRRTGVAAIVNAGHPLPLRVRDGRTETVELAVDLPFGIVPGRRFRIQEVALRPGDRLVLLTDGMLERNAAELDVEALLARTAALHPRQVVQELGSEVMRVTGARLRDDATVLCLDWHGGPVGGRRTDVPHPVGSTAADAGQ